MSYNTKINNALQKSNKPNEISIFKCFECQHQRSVTNAKIHPFFPASRTLVCEYCLKSPKLKPENEGAYMYHYLMTI